jgi:hypothetical protein
MTPHWRQLQKALDKIYRSVENISRRAKAIDHSMQEYQDIRAQTDAAERALAASSTTQFFVSGLFLVVAIAGAMINFHLIAAPMSGLIGSAATVGPYPTSVVAGLVIILIELSMGLFLMESLRITRLFPIIGALDDKMRQRMIAVTLVLLAGLAGFEAVLTFIGDRTTQSTGALQETMAATGESAASMPLIPAVGQMLLAIILPFALAFVAIPLETFVSSSRTVFGVLAAGSLRLLAFALRLLGNIAYYCGRFIINSYDLIIFPTIWLEGLVLGARTKKMTESPEREPLLGEPLNPVDKTMKNQEQQK